jgi:hypothetical protein
MKGNGGKGSSGKLKYLFRSGNMTLGWAEQIGKKEIPDREEPAPHSNFNYHSDLRFSIVLFGQLFGFIQPLL